ncbi:TPA: hypothetical protein ACWK7A_005019, partial [Escherichia coli]
LMHDAAAWMSAKGTPAWDVARIDRTFAETFVLRSELLGEHEKPRGSHRMMPSTGVKITTIIS